MGRPQDPEMSDEDEAPAADLLRPFRDATPTDAVRTVAAILATYALGWVVQYGARRAWQAFNGFAPIDLEARARQYR